MPKTLTLTSKIIETPVVDRPGWIPSDITHDWDSSPYAYQTEEELMPAGGLHGQLLAYVMELLRHALQTKGLMLLLDTFMLYRDRRKVKQRISPDLLLMPYRFPPPSAYDLDKEPPPLCVVEVTSPNSHLKDLRQNVSFYAALNIPTYLAIDAVTPRSQLRAQIELHLWRTVHGRPQSVLPDAQGRFHLPEMGLLVEAIGQRIIFRDADTDEILFDNGQLLTALVEEREARLAEQQQARQAEREQIALAMWRKGLDVAMIAEVTGLSEAALGKLIDPSAESAN